MRKINFDVISIDTIFKVRIYLSDYIHMLTYVVKEFIVRSARITCDTLTNDKILKLMNMHKNNFDNDSNYASSHCAQIFYLYTRYLIIFSKIFGI